MNLLSIDFGTALVRCYATETARPQLRQQAPFDPAAPLNTLALEAFRTDPHRFVAHHAQSPIDYNLDPIPA